MDIGPRGLAFFIALFLLDHTRNGFGERLVMSSMKSLWVTAITLVAMMDGSIAQAGIYYGDGQTHVVGSASPDITLANNTTLLVVPGAAITGAVGVNGITGSNSTVNLSGGSVVGGAGDGMSSSVPAGISLAGGSFVASGGNVTGGVYTGLGGDGVDLAGTSATISGGTFSAGATNSGYGLKYINFGVGNLLNISGGTFNGGSEAVLLTLGSGSGSATISGGSFQAQGGTQAIGATLSNGAQLNISGGSFSSQIFANSGTTGGSLNFFGTGLTFTPTFTSTVGVQGFLSGTLSSGQVLTAQRVSFFGTGYQISSSANEFSFVVPSASAVPEPASLVMMAFGLSVVGLVSARRNRGTRPRSPLDRIN